MYQSFFNLNKKPFELLPNPEFMFFSRSHKRALVYLDHGIKERAGFILLTGEVGSGKTTLIRNLMKAQDERMLISRVFNTRVDSVQLLAMINDDFGLQVAGKDKVTLLRELNNFLIEQYAKGSFPVLVIDEAQNLSAELLEEVRMLSNLETDDAKLLQIILVGQPELREILAVPGMRQLRQRIGINCHLNPLTPQETESYIQHRLEVAGDRSAITFEPPVLEIICKYSRGIPRLVNIICDFLMLAAFAEETKTIDEEMVKDVIGDLDFDENYWAPDPVKQPETDAAARNEIIEMLKGITTRLDTYEQEVAERVERVERFVKRLAVDEATRDARPGTRDHRPRTRDAGLKADLRPQTTDTGPRT